METTAEKQTVTEPRNGELLKMKAMLAKKKLAVIAATGSVPKNGKNTFNDYDYAMASDTFDIIRRALVVGIAFTAEVESFENYIPKEGARSVGTRIWMLYTLTDTDTGYSETVRWPGDAHDTGDKGLCKAQTNAMKYFCFQQFMLPTGLDVEQDDHGDNDKGLPKVTGKLFVPAPPRNEPSVSEQNADRMLGEVLDAMKPAASTKVTPPVSKVVKPTKPSIQDIARPVTDAEVTAVAIIVEHIQNKTGRPVDFDSACQAIFDHYGKFPQQLKDIDICKKYMEKQDVFEKVA